MATRSQRIQSIKAVGHYLQTARRQRGVTIDAASKDLHIAFKYIEAIEVNNFKAIPAESLETFIKQYARYLSLDEYQVWRLYVTQHQSSHKRQFGLDFRSFQAWPRFIRRGLLVALVALVAIFLIFKIEQIFVAPSLTVVDPRDGNIVSTPQIVVRGSSEPESEIIINQRTVLADTTGQFEAVVDLQKGLNLIKITAKKRYSRVREVELHILYQGQN